MVLDKDRVTLIMTHFDRDGNPSTGSSTGSSTPSPPGKAGGIPPNHQHRISTRTPPQH